jgi:iron complex outermembrane receptor protein
LRRTDNTTNAFIQDTITLAPDRLHLTLGTKVENNDYSGTEWQPNARLAWTPDTHQTFWTAYSRAVRVPSRLEADLVFGGTRLGDNVRAERVHAYEAGYRRLVTSAFSYDVATFYNVYDNLLTAEQGFQFRNQMHAQTYGLELAGRWQMTPSWRLDAAYTYLHMKLGVDASSIAVNTPQTVERSNPQHQLALRSAVDIGRDFELDATLRFVDDLAALSAPAYTTLDLGLSWFARRDLELSLVGQNLLDNHHPEQRIFDPATGVATGTEVQRGVYTKLTWRF